MTAESRARGSWRPPSTPIRLGIVGLGNVGLGHHVPALLTMPELVRIVAIADPSEERRAAAVEVLGLEPSDVYDDPVALIGDADVDAVDLATPPSIRVPLALEAIGNGRAVICEKPIATTPAEAVALADAAAGARVPVALIHNYLWLPEILAARRAIEDGAIGVPEVAILNYLGVEDRPGNRAWQPGWRHDPAVAGGGVLMDMLHVVYVAEALLGTPFRRVSAELLARVDGAPVEGGAVCRFEADRAIALVNVGWGVGPGGIAVSAAGGRIEIHYAGGGTGPFSPLESVHLTRADGRVEDLTPRPVAVDGAIDVRFATTFRDIFERLAGGRPPATSVDDGRRVLEATFGAYLSAAVGRTVDLPLGPDHPVHRRGIAGLADVTLDRGGVIARRGVFGLGGT